MQSEQCLCHATCYRMCSDVMRTSRSARMQASRPPYVYMACKELLMDVPFMQAEQYLSKLTASLLDMCRRTCRTSVQVVGINSSGMEISQS